MNPNPDLAAESMKHRRPRPMVAIAPAGATAVAAEDLVTKAFFQAITGVTVRAQEGKIARGQWIEGRQFFKDPTGAIWISRKGVAKWILGGT